jgi:hypothetical protein
MQIFDKNRFLFGFALSWIFGMPSTVIAESHLSDSDERKPVIIQLERLPEIAPHDSDEKKPIATQLEKSPEIVPRESDELKNARDRQRESRKKRAKLKNAILLERNQKRGLAITRRDLQGIEGIKNTITIDPKDNWLIIQLGEEVIVINPSELRLPPPEILRGGNKSVNPTIHIPGVHRPADDLY